MAEQEDSERLRRLEKVYAATTRGELHESYAEWARDYDRDVMAMGYMSPTLVACMTARHVPQTSGLLDAGCGTGLLGLMLAALGYPRVTGIDMSEAMLAIARQRSVYESCRRMVLGERLDFQDATFGAVVAAGVFTAGHAPPHSFAELSRIVVRRGYVVLGLRAAGDAGEVYRKACAAEEGKNWHLVAESAAFQAFPLSPAEAHVLNIVRVYQTV
jgi:predicted TPR repeat methyltransferase